jgi:hypothetical protein
MRKRKTVRVTRGDLEATAPTAKEARALLDPQIDAACKHRGAHIEKRFGWIIVITPTLNGWDYTYFWPVDLKDGQEVHTKSGTGERDFERVRQEVRLAVAQLVWRHEMSADEIVARAGLNKAREGDFRRWVDWQRAYRAAKDLGATDADAREIASGLKAMPSKPLGGAA